MRSPLRLLLLALSLLALGLALGCIPLVTGVSAFADAGVGPRTRYALQGPDPRRPGGDPRWPAREAMVVKALASQGYVRDEAAPQLLLRVGYGAGEGRTFQVTERRGAGKHGHTTTTRYETATLTLRLEALDPASVAADDPVVLWSVLGEAQDSRLDLEAMFPFMLASMEPYLGRAAEARVQVTKRLWDPEARRLGRP